MTILCPCCSAACTTRQCPTCETIQAITCPHCAWHIPLPRLLDEMLLKLPNRTLAPLLRSIAHDRAHTY